MCQNIFGVLKSMQTAASVPARRNGIPKITKRITLRITLNIIEELHQTALEKSIQNNQVLFLLWNRFDLVGVGDE